MPCADDNQRQMEHRQLGPSELKVRHNQNHLIYSDAHGNEGDMQNLHLYLIMQLLSASCAVQLAQFMMSTVVSAWGDRYLMFYALSSMKGRVATGPQFKF